MHFKVMISRTLFKTEIFFFIILIAFSKCTWIIIKKKKPNKVYNSYPHLPAEKTEG